MDGIEYSGNTIDIIHTEEGIARNNAGSYSYEYNLTDQLGNVRATFYKNPNTGNLEILQRDDYYAFGKRKVVQGGVNKYLYNGKEVQDELGEQYDYGARFYDPVIGRFITIDPLSELDRRWSPYVYTSNDPMRFTDPDGMWPDGGNDGILDFPTGAAMWEAIKHGAKAFGSGIEIGVSATATAITGTVALVLLPQSTGIADVPQNKFPILPPPVIPPGIKKDNQVHATEHTKNARPSTQGKHEKGQSRKQLDRGGEKGEKLPPRKRPDGHKGPWPPKKK